MTHRQSYDDHVDIDAWVWWLIAAVGLGIPLVLTAMPEFGMFAVGAVAAAVAAALGGGIVAQVLVFVVVSVALLVVVRPIAAAHRQTARARSGIDALKGRQAVVLERVDGDDGGRIKLAGEVWSARALDDGPGLRTRPAGRRRGDRRSDRRRHVTDATRAATAGSSPCEHSTVWIMIDSIIEIRPATEGHEETRCNRSSSS